jgi:hypothetical protein
METLEDRCLLSFVIWTGASGDGKWSTPGNWLNNTVPGSTDTVEFNFDGDNNSTVDAAWLSANPSGSIEGLQLNAGFAHTLNVDIAQLSVGAGGIDVSYGAIQQSSGNAISDAGDWNIATSGILSDSSNSVEFNGADQSIDSGGNAFNGSVLYDGGGTATLANNAMSVLGGFTLNGSGTFQTSGQALNVKNITDLKQGKLLTDGSLSSFQNIKVEGGTLDASTATYVTVAGDVEIDSGSLVAPGGTFEVDGNWTNAGILLNTKGTIFFNGTGAESVDSSSASTADFYNIQYGGSGSLKLVNSDLTADGEFDLTGTGTVDLNSHKLSVGGALSVSNGELNLNGGTVEAGSCAVAGGTFDASSGTTGTALTLNGDFSESSGVFDAPAQTSAAGNWQFAGGTFSADSGTITLDDPNPCTVDAGGAPGEFYDLNISDDASLVNSSLVVAHDLDIFLGALKTLAQKVSVANATSIQSATYTGGSATQSLADVDLLGNLVGGSGDVSVGNLNIDASGYLSLGSGTIHVAGDWTNAGIFAANTGTVDFDGSSTQQIDSTGAISSDFYNLTHSGSSALQSLNTPLIVEADYEETSTGSFDASGEYVNIQGLAKILSGSFSCSSGPVQIGGGLDVEGGSFDAGVGNVLIDGGVSLSGGSVNLDAAIITIDSGDWVNSGASITAGTSSVSFASAAPQVLRAGSGGGPFFDLNIDSPTQIKSDLHVTDDLSIQSTFDANGFDVVVDGMTTIFSASSSYVAGSGSNMLTGGVELFNGANFTIGSNVTDTASFTIDTSDCSVTAGAGQIVSGSVSLGGASLVLPAGFLPVSSQTLIENTGADAVENTFAGLPESSPITIGARSFEISYVAGDGNDVVLVAVPYHLVFINQPSNVIAGQLFCSPITVYVADQNGNVVKSDNSLVTISVASGPAGAVLYGKTSAQAKNGVAIFGNLYLTTAGTYTLAIVSSGAKSATTKRFTVYAAPAAKLAFGQQPGDAGAGMLFTPLVTVSVEDRYGNLVTCDYSKVTLTLKSGSTVCNGVRSNSLNAVNGVATFGNLAITTSGTFTLQASDGRLAATVSNPFAIIPGPAVRMNFLSLPAKQPVGNPFSVEVVLLDQYGNVATGDTSSVTLNLGTHPKNAMLNGNVTSAVVDGIATFTNLTVNVVGIYRLIASDVGIPPITSAQLNLT